MKYIVNGELMDNMIEVTDLQEAERIAYMYKADIWQVTSNGIQKIASMRRL